jgi:DNA-binding MarR family transcriptional regulator
MSIKYMSLAFKTRVGNPLAKLIFLKLADHANDDGICWPSIRRIAEDAECDERTVRRRLRHLEELGLVFVERRQQDGVHLPCVYRLLLEGGGGRAPPPLAERPRGGGRAPPGVGAERPPPNRK